MWQTFDVNVLVNGNRCKQYNHEGRTYIEAKDGSEWYFQIQNNSPSRVLAICSVDGLNVLTGESATENDTGYIIDAYHSQKIKGFRFSDDEWALFKFGYKVNKDTGAKNEKVYAVSKGDGKEKNCGVIGVKLFYEVPKVVKYVPPVTPIWYTTKSGITGSYYGTASWSTNTSYAVSASYSISGCMSDHVNWTPGASDLQLCSGNLTEYNRNSLRDRFNRVRSPSYNSYTRDNSILSDAIADAKAVRATSLANCKGVDKPKFQKLAGIKKSEPKTRGFDMGTEWGKKEKSIVEVIAFERGCEAFSIDIYYASRESLIEMGVPISNNIKINLPQSFVNKYATPPKGWNG